MSSARVRKFRLSTDRRPKTLHAPKTLLMMKTFSVFWRKNSEGADRSPHSLSVTSVRAREGYNNFSDASRRESVARSVPAKEMLLEWRTIRLDRNEKAFSLLRSVNALAPNRLDFGYKLTNLIASKVRHYVQIGSKESRSQHRIRTIPTAQR